MKSAPRYFRNQNWGATFLFEIFVQPIESGGGGGGSGRERLTRVRLLSVISFPGSETTVKFPFIFF